MKRAFLAFAIALGISAVACNLPETSASASLPANARSTVSNIDEPFVVPILLDFTGPFAEQSEPVQRALNAFSADNNKRASDLSGRPIAFRYYDHASDPLTARQAWTQALAELNPPAVMVAGSDASEALKPLAARARVPVLEVFGSGRLQYPPGWVFSSSADGAETCLAFFRWALRSWNQPRPMRIAFITADTSSARASLRAIAEIEKERGVEVVASEFVPVIPVDVADQVARIINSRADYLFTVQSDRGVALLLRTLDGMSPRGSMRIVTGDVVRAPTLDAKVGKGSVEGLFQTMGASLEIDRQGMVANELEVHPLASGEFGSEIDSVHTLSFLTVSVLFQALERSVQQTGWGSLSGDVMYKALENGVFDTRGLARSFSFSRERRNGLTQMRITTIQGGRQRVVSDWLSVVPILSK